MLLCLMFWNTLCDLQKCNFFANHTATFGVNLHTFVTDGILEDKNNNVFHIYVF
jgi:hypothetical protein